MVPLPYQYISIFVACVTGTISETYLRTFTMHCNAPFASLGQVQKALQYGITRCTAISEEQIMVFKASICKPSAVVDLLVEAYNAGDIVLPKVREIGFWCMERVTCEDIITTYDQQYDWGG